MKQKEIKFVSTFGISDVYRLDEMKTSQSPQILMTLSEIRMNTDAINFAIKHPECEDYPDSLKEAVFLEDFINDGWEIISADIEHKKYLLQREKKATEKESA